MEFIVLSALLVRPRKVLQIYFTAKSSREVKLPKKIIKSLYTKQEYNYTFTIEIHSLDYSYWGWQQQKSHHRFIHKTRFAWLLLWSRIADAGVALSSSRLQGGDAEMMEV